MRLNEIETSIVIGRTVTGTTITVLDLVKALATVSGTTLGSSQFNQVLSDPQMIHAPDTICNARRYALLSAMLSGDAEPPECFDITQEAGETSAVQIHVTTNTNPGLQISEVLDQLLAAKEKRHNL